MLLKEPVRGTVQLFNIIGHTSLCVVKNKIYYPGKSAQTTLHHRTLAAAPLAEPCQGPRPAALPSRSRTAGGVLIPQRPGKGGGASVPPRGEGAGAHSPACRGGCSERRWWIPTRFPEASKSLPSPGMTHPVHPGCQMPTLSRGMLPGARKGSEHLQGAGPGGTSRAGRLPPPDTEAAAPGLGARPRLAVELKS